MIFIDGEKWPPSFHGTGTEEIFGGGACPNVEYSGPYTGFHLISHSDWSGKNSMYRFFVSDPVRFEKSIRVTIEHGHANNLANDYSSVAYWYQTEPHKEFTPLLSAEERVPLLPVEGKELVDKEKRIYRVFQSQGGALSTLRKTKQKCSPYEVKSIGHLIKKNTRKHPSSGMTC